ncbi:hypothetical protein NSTC745_06226 [Nostoc sp. DSM 114161]|jgi:hypothetical protein|uniref:hypothetical protein n=1 Tax=Nostoc sp. DSM 114161 TaxID=3440143 RepID=UPI0040459B61
MFLKVGKNLAFIVLLIALVFAQFGCRPVVRHTRSQLSKNTDVLHQTERRLSRNLRATRKERKQLQENQATWNAVVNAINAGLLVKTEVMARRDIRYKQKNQVSVKISIPVNQSDSVTQESKPLYKLKYASIDCLNINDDSAIIQRNKLNNDDSTSLNPEDTKKLVDFIREASLSQCQKT